MSSRIWLAFILPLVTLLVIFYIAYSAGQNYFGFHRNDLFWFLFFCFGAIFTVWTVVAKSVIDFYADKIESIDAISKQTLHELSTPIATIKANCGLLKTSVTDEKDINRLARISKASSRLMELYEELEWSIKNSSSKQPAVKVMVDELIEDVLDDFVYEIESKELVITTDFELLMVEIDLFGLKKTVSNIVGNAIKFSDKGSEIVILLKSKVLSVKNRGQEVKPEELMLIFDKYYRGEGPHNGYGIGLYSVKMFCDKNAIPIKISSNNFTTLISLDFGKF